MPLSPYVLTTLGNTKDQLGVPSSNTNFDTLLERLINEASDRIETFCDRFLKQRTGITEYQDGIAQDRILLDQWPATLPSELWVDPTGLFTDTRYRLDPGAYALDLSARGEGIGVVRRDSCFFPRGTKNIKVVYDGGYANIPAALEGACLLTVQFLYDMRDNHSVGVETKGKNQENTTYRANLPEYVQETLLAYKRAEWPTGDRALSTR